MTIENVTDHGPEDLVLRNSPELFDLREQALSAVRRRLLGPAKNLVDKFPELRLVGRFAVFFDEDIVVVHCNTYTSERSLKRRFAATAHPYPRLYTRDRLVAEVNLNIEDGTMNNGIGNCVVRNPAAPALRIGSDVTFIVHAVKFELDEADESIYNYPINIAFLVRFGPKINGASFSTYFESLLISYIGFLRAVKE